MKSKAKKFVVFSFSSTHSRFGNQIIQKEKGLIFFFFRKKKIMN